MQLYCLRHLRERNEIGFENCYKKTRLPDSLKERNKNEVMWDIYGRRGSSEIFERGVADSIDEVDLVTKLSSFESHFINCVILSARDGTSVEGLFYQNDIESQHAIQKRIQHFNSGSVNTMKTKTRRDVGKSR